MAPPHRAAAIEQPGDSPPAYGATRIVQMRDIRRPAATATYAIRATAPEGKQRNQVVRRARGARRGRLPARPCPCPGHVEGIVTGIFYNQGHVCCAGSRLLVQENIAEDVVDRLKRRLSTLRVGDPLDKNTDVGAINSAAQLARITELAQVGEDEGATRWSPACDLPTTGYWFAPTVFTGVSNTHRIAREEVFGPVLSVLTFRTPDEAVAKANNTTYGLSAGVWSDKGSRILWTADRLRAGVVWANTFNRFDPTSPFGGYKESGFGREGGRHGLEAYCAQ